MLRRDSRRAIVLIFSLFFFLGFFRERIPQLHRGESVNQVAVTQLQLGNLEEFFSNNFVESESILSEEILQEFVERMFRLIRLFLILSLSMGFFYFFRFWQEDGFSVISRFFDNFED